MSKFHPRGCKHNGIIKDSAQLHLGDIENILKCICNGAKRESRKGLERSEIQEAGSQRRGQQMSKHRKWCHEL